MNDLVIDTKGNRTITVSEFRPVSFFCDALSVDEGLHLHHDYGEVITVEFPNPRTQNRWVLTPGGWVGTIPLSGDLVLRLQPKTSIGNLFRMLEYAYDLKSFRILDGLSESDSLDDLYSRLARLLAGRIIARSHKGLYRSYVPEYDHLPFVRGTLDLSEALGAPWRVNLFCSYEEHTADVMENQILAWTLWSIIRHGICSENDLELVRRAYRVLVGGVSLRRTTVGDCLGRLYHRLIEDYRPMHALCRFFLAHTGPAHHAGEEYMLPFLVNMAWLYESFVARWIEAHLPPDLMVNAQENLRISGTSGLSITIDLVISRVATGETLCVLDTKYKAQDNLSTRDLHQIVSYAVAKRCDHGVLIYPTNLKHGFNERYGDVSVRAMGFYIDGNLEEAGERFLEELLGWCEAA